MKLLKSVLFLGFLQLCVAVLFGQDDGLPDILAQKPFGKEMPVKITREDSNYLYYMIQRGAGESKIEWSRVLTVRYGEESQNLRIGNDQLTGNPNYVGALASFERVLNEKSLPKWQVDMATFQLGICHLNMGNLDKAKERFGTITKSSRWYYPAKLRLVDTLPDNDKIPAIRNLLKEPDITGLFKVELSFMLVDRFVADEKAGEAKKAFDELRKLVTTPDKIMAVQLDEYQIKVDIMGKSYGEAEKKIKTYIASGTETGLMRISLGDIYLSKKDKTAAYYEYLRGRLDFEEVAAEAGYKAGKLFGEIWQEDKEKNAVFRKYAIKELNKSYSVGDGVWSVKAKRLLAQFNK